MCPPGGLLFLFPPSLISFSALHHLALRHTKSDKCSGNALGFGRKKLTHLIKWAVKRVSDESLSRLILGKEGRGRSQRSVGKLGKSCSGEEELVDKTVYGWSF